MLPFTLFFRYPPAQPPVEEGEEPEEGPPLQWTTFALVSSDRTSSDALSKSLGESYQLKGALCAYVIRSRVSFTQNDETLSRNLLRYLSKANLPMAVHY